MCMAIPKISQKLPKFVLGDKLVVYKVFIDEGKGAPLKTPHREAIYQIGKLNKSSITKTTITPSIRRHIPYIGTVVSQGLHAFVNIDDAIEEANVLQEKADLEYRRSLRNYGYWKRYFYDRGFENEIPLTKPSIKVYECHVPRFARYYRGYWEFRMPSLIDNIVASKLIVIGLANIPEKSNG